MRGTKSNRHTTEAEDEEMESEKKFHVLFNSLKPRVLRKIVGRQVEKAAPAQEVKEEVATRKSQVMKKHERVGKKSSSLRKAA